MLIYSFITDYQAFNLRYKDNTTRDKNETKVGKQSANLGKNNEPIQNRLSFLIDCKSVILHHLTILSFPMVRPAWDNWWLLVVLLVAILPSCEREHLSCYSETGNVILNIRPMDNDIDVDAINQYAIKIIPEYAGEILVGKIGNFNWPLSLNSGYYRIEIHSSVISVKDDTEYRYYGLSNLFKVESNESTVVPIEIKLSAFHVENKLHQ